MKIALIHSSLSRKKTTKIAVTCCWRCILGVLFFLTLYNIIFAKNRQQWQNLKDLKKRTKQLSSHLVLNSMKPFFGRHFPFARVLLVAKWVELSFLPPYKLFAKKNKTNQHDSSYLEKDDLLIPQDTTVPVYYTCFVYGVVVPTQYLLPSLKYIQTG